MTKIKCFVLITTIGLLFPGLVQAQQNKLIALGSVGPIKVGMTVAKARRAAKPLIISRGTPGFEGEVEYTVKNGKARVLTFVEYSGSISSIEVWNKSYRTADGVSVGMSLDNLEKIYGKIKKISIGEQDDFEYAVFTKHPKGLFLRVAVRGRGKRAGIYPDDSFSATRFNPGIYLQSIQTYGGDISEEEMDQLEESSDLNEANKIIYHFGDGSVGPEYHRSYTITITTSKAKLVVDSYGKMIAESEVDITSDELASVLKAVQNGNIKKQERTSQPGCTGGTSESLGLYRDEKELFKESASHCGGQDSGNLSGDVDSVRAKMSSYFPDFKKLIRQGVPVN